MKIAIAHEWFVSYAGSEKIVEQMNCFPNADLCKQARAIKAVL